MKLELVDVSKRYVSIHGLNLTLEDNCAAALVGESGSGKSTLARLIALLENPDSGEILIDGKNTAKLQGESWRKLRADMQLVLQNAPAALDPRVRVGKSIIEPLRNLTRLSRDEIERRVSEVCEQVSLAPGLLAHLLHELSGGQLKHVCFTRALALKPGFIVFDEITSGLDPSLRERIIELIVKIKKESLRSFLFITHDMDAALRVADRVLVMKEGAVIEDAAVVNKHAEFRNDYAKLLLESEI